MHSISLPAVKLGTYQPRAWSGRRAVMRVPLWVWNLLFSPNPPQARKPRLPRGTAVEGCPAPWASESLF